MKKCFKCKEYKSLANFYEHPQMGDGHVNKCKSCNKLDVRKNYRLKQNRYKAYDAKRQRDNFARIFIHRYNQVKARSTPGYAAARYYVTGLPVSPRKEFFEWFYDVDNLKSFYCIWVKWVQSGYDARYVPSIDRIDSKRGYTVDNIQWLTKSDNSRKGNKDKMFVLTH